MWKFLLVTVLSLSSLMAATGPRVSAPSVIRIDGSITSMAKDLYSGVQVRLYLMSSVMESKIAIKRQDQTFIGNGEQGILIDEWNLDIMAEAFKNGIHARLGDFLLGWQMAATSSHGAVVDETLNPLMFSKFLEDLKKAAMLPDSDQSGIRYMAQLIVALGRENPDNPYDLLNSNVSMDVPLNAIQFGLLSQRLAPEILMKARRLSPIVTKADPPVEYGNLSDTPLPCQMTETEGLVMDGVAAASGAILGGVQFFPGLLDHLVATKFVSDVGVEKYTKMATAANIGLNIAKLGYAMAAFRASMKADTNPLERTKNRTAGNRTNVSATFSMDGSQAQFVNCMRPALNAAGIDFSVQQSGPLVGSLVEWQIATKVGADNDVIQTVGSDPLHQTTDSNGHSEITIEGKPQKKDLTGKKLVQIDRQVSILAAVNLKNNNLKQDAVDLVGGLGGISALWSLPFEVLNRVPFLFLGKLDLVVKDWKELEGDEFKIEAVYTKPKFHDRGVDSFIREISKKIEVHFELKINTKNEASVQILSQKEDKTKYKTDFNSQFVAGEGCMGEQATEGEYEAFRLMKKYTTVTAAYFPGFQLPPGIVLPPGYQLPPEFTQNQQAKMVVQFAVQGIEHYPGWKFKVDDKSCEMDDIPEEDSTQGVSGMVSFDSIQLNQVGKSIVIDQTSGGYGWVYTITYVQ